MTNESQMKPKDWADAHGLKVDVVMKLLRDAGVAVRTHMSKLDMADFEKIEEAAAAEKQKQDARNKNLKRPLLLNLILPLPLLQRRRKRRLRRTNSV